MKEEMKHETKKKKGSGSQQDNYRTESTSLFLQNPPDTSHERHGRTVSRGEIRPRSRQLKACCWRRTITLVIGGPVLKVVFHTCAGTVPRRSLLRRFLVDSVSALSPSYRLMLHTVR